MYMPSELIAAISASVVDVVSHSNDSTHSTVLSGSRIINEPVCKFLALVTHFPVGTSAGRYIEDPIWHSSS